MIELARANGSYELREPEILYNVNFCLGNGGLRLKNTFYWETSD